MTIDAGERAGDRTAPAGDVSGSVVGALVALTRSQAGPGGVAQVLALADDRRDFARLGDPERWSSLPQAVALFNAASLVNEDGAIALHVGEHLLEEPGAADRDLEALGSPSEAFAEIRDLLAHFDTTASALPVEVSDDYALVRVTPRPGMTRHAHLCEMTRGLLSSLPRHYGRPVALVTESECAARGGRFCLYAVSWEPTDAGVGEATPSLRNGVASVVPKAAKPGLVEDAARATDPGAPVRKGPDESDPGDREAPSPGPGLRKGVGDEAPHELGATQVRAGARGSAAQREEDKDLGAILDRVVARAAELLGDVPFLLAVRMRPGASPHHRSRGFSADEAAAIAGRLLAVETGDAVPGGLVADVASARRHFGRLAVQLRSGARPNPSERATVELLGDYAAAALEVHAVRADARRDSATTRALLTFSEHLSRSTDLTEAVQLVVDAVPAITGSDRGVLHLWNDTVRHLVPGARTGTPTAERSFHGIIAMAGDGGLPDRATKGAAEKPSAVDSTAAEEAASGTGEADEHPADDRAPDEVLTLRTNAPLMDRLVNRREVIVIEKDVDDPTLRQLLQDDGSEAAVVAPLFAAGQLLGTLSAIFVAGVSPAAYRDPELHERLTGLADRAATALQNLALLDKISHLAWHDALTGLPNRRLFQDRVEQELTRSRRANEVVCLFFVDLDRFKRVNDTFGHAVGDELIREVGDRLVDTVRDQDTVARVGGDEFAILLPGLGDQLAIDEVARAVLTTLAQPIEAAGETLQATASIGIAVAPEHADTYDELLSRADEAMYRAKALGRNRFQTFTESPKEGAQTEELDQRALYRDLVHALGSDQFFVVYQPYVNLRTTEVLGVEALVRWRHPTHGVLEAPSFVPLAEGSEAIVALDAFVIAEACRQLRRWADAGLPSVRLTINLSSQDLEDPSYAANVERLLSENGIDPGRLELDVTDRVVLEEEGPARPNIEHLRKLGVRFNVDDFGRDNSSLARLGAFPISTLKIDRSFVQVLAPGGDSDELVTAIVDMADHLGLECVAEGVETPLQTRVLLQRGCTSAQGFFLCPPLMPAELEEALTVVGPQDVGPPDRPRGDEPGG